MNKKIELKEDEFLNKKTGEILNVKDSAFGKRIVHITTRENGSRRVSFDYSNCPSMCEQHTVKSTNINYLIEKFQPDELAAYIAAKNSHRAEVVGHDFSQEPNLQEAKNKVLEMRQAFEQLPKHIRDQFNNNHVQFLKFLDNEKNCDKLIELGLLTPEEIKTIKGEKKEPTPTPEKKEPATPPKKEKAE